MQDHALDLFAHRIGLGFDEQHPGSFAGGGNGGTTAAGAAHAHDHIVSMFTRNEAGKGVGWDEDI